jgi:mono/diheme cytochrome c family protein
MAMIAKLGAVTAILLVAGAASREPQQATRPDPALIAKGDSVYHGKLGGAICHVCHGQNAKGMPGMGPDLTDGKWLHSDGSLAAIEATIKTGVPKPKASSVVMPPGGGVPLDSVRVRAVAAYVWSLNARK